MDIIDTKTKEVIRSEGYTVLFNKQNGNMVRFGQTVEDDPDFSPMPEILDIEISTGTCAGKCPQCYKQNGEPNGVTKHMSIDTFQKILDRFQYGKANCLTQVALGLTDTTSNPDFWNILEECRNRGVIPNFTTHGIDVTPEIAERVSKLCGAVAVSIVNKEKSYDAVQMFTNAGMKQVNIHLTIYKERLNQIFEVINDIKTDNRLTLLNAIVLLTYKPKGRNIGRFTNLTFEEFSTVINLCDSLKLNYGMDSCSCSMYERWIEKNNRQELLQYCEKCESSCFSSYISVDGVYFPCSFSQGEPGWEEGINVLETDHFSEIWNSKKSISFRENLLKNNRKCPLFHINGV